jgi:hypothetical protein
MGEEISDGVLLDVREVDLASLLRRPVKSRTRTALDRILTPDADTYNAFNSSI